MHTHSTFTKEAYDISAIIDHKHKNHNQMAKLLQLYRTVFIRHPHLKDSDIQLGQCFKNGIQFILLFDVFLFVVFFCKWVDLCVCVFGGFLCRICCEWWHYYCVQCFFIRLLLNRCIYKYTYQNYNSLFNWTLLSFRFCRFDLNCLLPCRRKSAWGKSWHFNRNSIYLNFSPFCCCCCLQQEEITGSWCFFRVWNV